MAIQGHTKRIINNGTEEGRSFESYEALHKYCTHNGVKSLREYRAVCTPAATDGAGTAKAVASSTAVSQKGKTELTLVLASDTNDNAYDNQYVIVHYYTAAGVAKSCKATFNATNSTTEVAFTDLATGLVAVTDFYCFNQDDYGPVSGAATYGSAVYCSKAVEAGDNVCIGITGLVAGIADPEICFAHINATKQYPLLADMYGVGQIWGEREADDTGDDSLVTTLNYITAFGEYKTATCTNTTTHTDIIRYIDANGCYVGDFYHARELYTTKALVKAHHVCDHDGATHYAVIEALAYDSCHTTFCAVSSEYESFIGDIFLGWSSLTGLCTFKLSYFPYGSTVATILPRQFYYQDVIHLNERLAPKSLVSMTVQDDTGDAGTATVEVMYIEKI